MSYLHILNVYKNQTILLFKEAFALEKVNGTSANLTWDGEKLSFFSGGASHNAFLSLFDVLTLTQSFKDKFGTEKATIYGEAYGGKEQGMSKTYGDKLRFVAFDVEVNDSFVNVPTAVEIVKSFDLDFVPYERIPATVEALDAERDKPSVIAQRNGMGNSTDKFGNCPPIREGVVLRPVEEFIGKYGNRVISKHKRLEFQERENQPTVVDAEKQKIMDDANAIAEEWVNAVRLEHVLDKLGNPKDITQTGKVIAAMVEDVMREAAGEIIDTKPVRTAIGAKAGAMYRRLVTQVPKV